MIRKYTSTGYEIKKKKNLFERFAGWATMAIGSSAALHSAIPAITTWLVTGPVFYYSDTWQLIINAP